MLEAYRHDKKLPDIQPLRDEIARLAAPAKGSSSRAARSQERKPARHTPWSEYEQLAIARAQQRRQANSHVVVLLDPHCSMPIAARQMIQIGACRIGEVLARCIIPLKPVHARDQAKSRRRSASTKPADSDSGKVLNSDHLFQRQSRRRCARSTANQPAENRWHTAPNAEHRKVKASSQPAVAQTIDSTTRARTSSAAITMLPENILRVDAERIDSVSTSSEN